MSARNQLFIADHQQASRYARSGQGAPAELLDFGDVSDLELEVLAELAAKTVHTTGIEYELGMVDVDLDQLLVVPDAVTEVFAELPGLEDPEELKDLVAAWANSEEFDGTLELAEALVNQLAALAVKVVAAAEDSRLALYFLLG